MYHIDILFQLSLNYSKLVINNETYQLIQHNICNFEVSRTNYNFDKITLFNHRFYIKNDESEFKVWYNDFPVYGVSKTGKTEPVKIVSDLNKATIVMQRFDALHYLFVLDGKLYTLGRNENKFSLNPFGIGYDPVQIEGIEFDDDDNICIIRDGKKICVFVVNRMNIVRTCCVNMTD